jgi:FAD synthetase
MAGTVLLHLFAGSLARRHPSLESNSKPIKSLYIPVPSSVPALESFIDKCVQAYNLDLFHAGTSAGKSKGGEGMRRGLELYKQRYSDIDAILVGTRRGDPHGGAFACLLSVPPLPSFYQPLHPFYTALHALNSRS